MGNVSEDGGKPTETGKSSPQSTQNQKTPSASSLARRVYAIVTFGPLEGPNSSPEATAVSSPEQSSELTFAVSEGPHVRGPADGMNAFSHPEG